MNKKSKYFWSGIAAIGAAMEATVTAGILLSEGNPLMAITTGGLASGFAYESKYLYDSVREENRREWEISQYKERKVYKND